MRLAIRATIENYLQADAAARAKDFAAFRAALEQVVAYDGADVARAFAIRAVSPDLDYSSARALRKFVVNPIGGESALRIAVMGGPTTMQLVELLQIFLAGAHIDARIFQGDYGLCRQGILAPSEDLDSFAPQIIFLATSGRDVGRTQSVTATPGDVERAVRDEFEEWERLWQRANERWGATVIQNTFDVEPWGALGHFASRHAAAKSTMLEEVNREFARRAPPFVVLHDLRQLVLEAGARSWFDRRFYWEAKMPCGPECLVRYAHSVMSVIRALAGRSKKVLVLDLDNTLWGGTIGDAGSGGITLGQGGGEGEAFLAFQQYAKDLRDRGIVLAVCSKNDDARAREPFEQRRDMVLALSDFSVFLANWRDKAENLRAIAAQLDVGVDSLVFVDDNPAERALVRRLCPDVSVPDVGDDPSGYVEALARHRFFETASFTKEDAQRSAFYANDARRRAEESGAADLDQFLASLEMVARVEPVSALNIERVTQLVNKSNQFNLTTRRYTLAQIQALLKDPDWRSVTVSLRDRVGDNGMISVLFVKKRGLELDIDTWLMSCRVLQRGVEQFALAELVNVGSSLGCEALLGTYRPTERNGMVRDHYVRLGFTQLPPSPGGATHWRLPLRAHQGYRHHIAREGSA